MEFFINEVSLEGQYLTETEFTVAVKEFLSIFLKINQSLKDKKLYKDSMLLMQYQAIKDSNFEISLNKIKDKSLKRAFIDIVFNKLNPKEWWPEQVHSNNDFFDYANQTITKDVRNTSLAEVTERSLQNQGKIYLIINFTDSIFNICHPEIQQCCSIPIIKNNSLGSPVYLDGIDNK